MSVRALKSSISPTESPFKLRNRISSLQKFDKEAMIKIPRSGPGPDFPDISITNISTDSLN